MPREIESIPITRANVEAITRSVRARPYSPVVVPIAYALVRVPGTFAECIDGVLRDQTTVYFDSMNAPVGPSHALADERGHIYDAMATGITAATLLTGITADTTAVWTLQLNLADPTMPEKLKEFHRATPGIGLVAIVTPQVVYRYLDRLAEFAPVLHYPV